jgi:lincosamide nucleotidyltransferase A/C/D/E
VLELAVALGLDRFAVLEISGGGPYAAACAGKLSDRLTRAGIVSCLAPLDVPGATAGMGRQNRLALQLVGRVGVLRRLLMARSGMVVRRHPDRVLESGVAAAVDKRYLARPDVREGGWGVDALVGEQTRDHKDLDLIVRDAHELRMLEVLATHGFIQVRGVPQNFVLADERRREVDVHLVRFDDQGNGHLLSEDGEPFGHSTEAFAATGLVSGYPVACLSADAQMSNHSRGNEPGDTDVQDMRLLHDRLGTPFMRPYQSV